MFFFFKQKTAYEMRISDWSSDVCSSDLFRRQDLAQLLLGGLAEPEKTLAVQLLEAWPVLLPGMHRLEFEGGALTLTLAFGPITRMARQVSAGVDAFFLDGFAPRVNPDMWSRSLFGQLVRMANAEATADRKSTRLHSSH